MVRRRKRVPGILTVEGFKAFGLVCSFVGAVYGNVQAGIAKSRAADADARAGAVAAYSVNVGLERDALARRVARLEGQVRVLKRAARIDDEVVQYGPQPAPAGYRPQSHGLLWRITHPMGDR